MSVIGGATAAILSPLVIELIITALRAGREALQLIKTSNLESLPDEVKAELLAKRDALDAEFDRLTPP